MHIFPDHHTDSSTRRSLTFITKDYEHCVGESWVRRESPLNPVSNRKSQNSLGTHYALGKLRNARSRSVQRTSTPSIPTLSRSRDGGRFSCPGTLARRSMVDSTAPRLVACWMSCTPAHTASAAEAPPRTSNEIIVPKPLSWRRAAA